MTLQKKKRNRRPRIITALILILSFLIAVIPGLSLSAQSSDTDEITIVREEQDRRTANEKHFLCSDGSMMAVSYSGDVHYLDAEGNYQPIDNTLTYNAARKQYRTVGNPNFNVTFAGSAGQPVAAIQDEKGNLLATATSVAFTTAGNLTNSSLAAQPASIFVQNGVKTEIAGLSKDAPEVTQVSELHSEILYQNAHTGGVSSEYAVDGYSLKENVIFDRPVNYTSIKTEYEMEGLCVEVTEEGSLLLYNDTWDLVYTVAAPYMYDAAGQVCPSVAVSAALTDGVWTVTYIPDEAWRTSPDRVYPVVFDPSLSYETNSVLEDSFNIYSGSYPNTNTNTFNQNRNISTLRAGTQLLSNTYIKYDTYMKLSFPTVPSGNISTQAEIILSASDIVESGTLCLYSLIDGYYYDGNKEELPKSEFTLDSSWLSMVSYHFTHEATMPYQYKLLFSASLMNTVEGHENEYVLRETNGSGTSSHYVSFYSAEATAIAKRPKAVLYYIPQGISNKITALYNSTTGRYLTIENDGTVVTTAASTPNSLWKFESMGQGCFLIRSHSNPDVCLSINADGDVVLSSTPNTTTDGKLLWNVFASGGTYTFATKERPDKKLYVKEDGSVALDLNSSTTAAQKKWQMVDLAPGVNGTETCLVNPEAGGFLVTSSDSTIDIVSGVTKDQWKFVQSNRQSFQIVSMDNSDYCLAADANGNVSLATKSSSVAQTTQYWYLTESQGGYIIENVESHKKLSVSTQNGALTCTLSDEDQVWTFMDYDVPTEVSMLSSLANPTLYLKNASGKNYNGIVMSTGPDSRSESKIGLKQYIEDCNEAGIDPDSAVVADYRGEIYGDKCGFRIVYDTANFAYRIMPISSAVGYYRAIAKSASGYDVSLLDYELGKSTLTQAEKDRMMFIIELQTDGSFVIRQKSDPTLCLTDNGNSSAISLTTLASTGLSASQKWIFSTYEFILPDGTKEAYTEVENYYQSLNFGNPFGEGNNVSERITSDFGSRNSGFHAGIDIGVAYVPLYSTYEGTVIAADYDSVMGNYVKIATTATEYTDYGKPSKIYDICIVYMHLDSIETYIKKGYQVSEGTKIGISGNTGRSSGAHLHYGVYLRVAAQGSSSINYDLLMNPFLIYSPESYDVIP